MRACLALLLLSGCQRVARLVVEETARQVALDLAPPARTICRLARDPAEMERVRQSTIAAYREATRDLDFRAPFSVSAKEWRGIMNAAAPGGYNAFRADPIAAWLARYDGVGVCPAREGSVAVYLIAPPATLESMLADLKRPRDGGVQRSLAYYVEEAHIADDMLRLWWD